MYTHPLLGMFTQPNAVHLLIGQAIISINLKSTPHAATVTTRTITGIVAGWYSRSKINLPTMVINLGMKKHTKFPSKIEWDLTNGPVSKFLEPIDTQV